MAYYDASLQDGAHSIVQLTGFLSAHPYFLATNIYEFLVAL